MRVSATTTSGRRVRADISPKQEKLLLREWVETTQFDRVPAGIPPLQPEDDDEDDD